MRYTLRGIKEFQGMEEEGLSASLYRDDKQVAQVLNDGWGGGYYIEWLDFNAPKTNISVTDDKGNPYTFLGTPEEKIFYEHLETLPKTTIIGVPYKLKVTPNIFLDQLLEEYETEQRLRRWCKNKTVCVTTSCAEGEFLILDVPFCLETKQTLLKTRNDIVEFVNERFAR